MYQEEILMENIINPWTNIKKMNNLYIADCDKNALQHIINKPFNIKLNNIPHPYMGNPQKSVVYILLGNFTTECTYESICTEYEDILLANLKHEIIEYPFFALNPEFMETYMYKWYLNKLLGRLDGEFGRNIVTNYIFTIEYFPYTSESSFKYFDVPSQKYSFYLVKEAIKNKKIIIVGRKERLWYNAIPELKNYELKYETNDPKKQNVRIDENNLGEVNFNKIINKLKAYI